MPVIPDHEARALAAHKAVKAYLSAIGRRGAEKRPIDSRYQFTSETAKAARAKVKAPHRWTSEEAKKARAKVGK